MLKKSLFSTTQFGFVFCVLEPLSEVRECSAAEVGTRIVSAGYRLRK